MLNNSRIKPVCNQIELHPYFQNDKLVDFCQNNGILVVGYTAVGAVDIAESRSDVAKVLQDETLIKLGEKYGKTPAQICLRWSLQRGCVPLVKALQFDKILENAQVEYLKITNDL